MESRPITVVETAPFIRNASRIWDDRERSEFIGYIAVNPTDGDIIPDTGGLRKVRWSRQGSGKRGGVRVVYFYYDMDTPLFLFTIYAKSEADNLSPDDKKAFAKLVAELKLRFRH